MRERLREEVKRALYEVKAGVDIVLPLGTPAEKQGNTPQENTHCVALPTYPYIGKTLAGDLA
ncbi:hypothetical protein SK128_013307 [Halocaridina rubra]|uniref:Uncharacterized protein n=1 Tax=Halocaridina rubra TaxID=373956 RepID=A0AAN8XQK6_HALRR